MHIDARCLTDGHGNPTEKLEPPVEVCEDLQVRGWKSQYGQAGGGAQPSPPGVDWAAAAQPGPVRPTVAPGLLPPATTTAGTAGSTDSRSTADQAQDQASIVQTAAPGTAEPPPSKAPPGSGGPKASPPVLAGGGTPEPPPSKSTPSNPASAAAVPAGLSTIVEGGVEAEAASVSSTTQ